MNMHTDNKWFVKFSSRDNARLRLFCFPYAGGGAAIFRTWARDLPKEIEVCAIELPGRGTRLREPLFTRLPTLVEAISPAILPHLDKPFAFFGHSMGALLGFEVARWLRRQGSPSPVHLFVSGCRSPQIAGRKPDIHLLPDALFIEELRSLNGTPDEILRDSDLRRLFLPILRADLAVSETYAYSVEGPLDCPISAFGGQHDSMVSPADLSAWRMQTNSDFALRMFAGDHFFLKRDPAFLLEAISNDIAGALDRVREGQYAAT